MLAFACLAVDVGLASLEGEDGVAERTFHPLFGVVSDTISVPKDFGLEFELVSMKWNAQG